LHERPYNAPRLLVDLFARQRRIVGPDFIGKAIVLADEQRMQGRQPDLLVGPDIPGKEELGPRTSFIRQPQGVEG